MTSRSLLLDIQLYQADIYSKQNLLSTRNAYTATNGSILNEVIGLPASMVSPLVLSLITSNKITILRSSSPITITYTPTSGSSTSLLINDIFVLSHGLTALSVQNANTTIVDLFYSQS